MTPAALAARHVCLAAQPRSVNGSPDTLIVRGVDATLAVTEQLAEAIVRAVSGKSSARAIEAAIKSTAKGFGTKKLAAPIERELLHGALLGALDSAHEVETGNPVKVETFRALHSQLLASDTGFAGRPIKEAINAFLKKKAVTRDVFDGMEKEAQRRAFTVAGMASDAMVSTVKRELIRQVAVGADLSDFGKNAAKRFEAAGWTPANPSHVETVFRTNVMGAYSGGRVRQMTQPEVLAVRPYWQSLSVGDGPPRQRPTHRTFVLLASDPFWQEAAPPYGFNCRCRLRSLSVKQGASMVQSGSSIHGLPDPGFTSGIGSMFATGSEPSRDPPPTPPANDTGGDAPANDTGGDAPAPANDATPAPREPANDTQPRAPTEPVEVQPAAPPADLAPAPPKAAPKPRAPRKPKPPPEAPSATPLAEALKEHGAEFNIAGKVTAEHQEAVHRGLGKFAFGTETGVPKLDVFEMTTETVGRRKVHSRHNALPGNTGGMYFIPDEQRGFDSRLRVSAKASTLDRFVKSHQLVDGQIPAETLAISKTRAEVLEMTTVHEYAHHVHKGKASAKINGIIRSAYMDRERQDVSKYGKDSPEEFFAESVTAYHYYPPGWMARNAPKSLAMVEEVLKLRGLL